MDIRIETSYQNCLLSLNDIYVNDEGDFSCTIIFNSGWLSCNRLFIFSKINAKSFFRKLNKIEKPFDTIASLEDRNINSLIRFECIVPGTIMVLGEFFEESEFAQQATLGFSIDREKLTDFKTSIGSLLNAANN